MRTGAKLLVATFVVIIMVSSTLVVGATFVAPSAPSGALAATLVSSVLSTPASAISPILSGSASTATSTAAVVTPAGDSSNPAAGITFGSSATRDAAVSAAYQATLAQDGNANLFEPPNLNVAPAVTATDDHIVPLYSGAPAPMGVGVFGLANTTGTVTPYILNTTSVLGTFTTSDAMGVQSTSPYFSSLQAYGAQLNVVLTNTTIKGTGGNYYWLQNVINYNPTTDSLSVENNIWNFTNASFYFPAGGILHGNGRINDNEYYAVNGPSFTIAYPFTLNLYVNTTVGSYDGSPHVNEVYFNYSLYNGLGQYICPTSGICGSYDNVYFNSGVDVAQGSAEVQANGFQYNPAGLATDMEMDWGIGTSNGATASVNYADAQVGIYVWNATLQEYVAPPSAYDFGSDTGETGLGAYGTWTPTGINHQPIETLTAGPSLLVGLWNASGTTSNEGAVSLNYADIAPGNAFVAIAYGANVTNQSYFSVAPTFGWFSGKGTIGPNIHLQPGWYTVEVMLSGYDLYTTSVNLTSTSQSLHVALTRDTSSTVFTPEWAYSNSDLANLSVSGSGTSTNPYVIFGGQQGTDSLEPVFATLNDYLFIVWSGIWLNGTTAYATFAPVPTLLVDTPSWWIETAERFGPTPLNNQLPIYLYHAQNVTIADGTGIGGWSSSNGYPGRAYTLYINTGKNDLVYDNYFNVSSEGLDILGGTATSSSQNYVWGNTFYPYSNPAYTGIETPSTGLAIADSGDHIYNNAFYTNGTATQSSTTDRNFWNATGGYQPASNAILVNNEILAGSILGQAIQGGNYWFNYGTVANPYGIPYVARSTSPTGTAGIRLGADFAPLSPYMNVALAATVPTALGVGLYPVTFTETGLASGASWGMRLSGVPVYEPQTRTTYTTNPTNTTTVTTNVLWVPNGTYTWTQFSKPTGTTAVVSSGIVNVYGGPAGVQITFGYTVTFTESGLTTGTEWAATLNGHLVTSTTTTIVIAVAPGTWSYSASAVPAGWVSPPSGTVTVTNAAKSVALTFSPVSGVTHTVYFTQNGLPAGTPWSVTVNGNTVSGATTTLSATLTAGVYTYSYGSVSGYATPSDGSVTVGAAAVSLGANYVLTTYTVTFTETGLPGATLWAVAFGGVLYASTTGSITIQVAPATYGYLVGVINGYAATPSSGSQDVTGSVNIPIVFSA